MSLNSKLVTVIVLAAGSGSRMGAGKNKLFLEIKGFPILYRTLLRLNQIDLIDEIILICKKSERSTIERMIQSFGNLDKLKEILEGGRERSDSVRNGLQWIKKQKEERIVMTHDGARPFITNRLVSELATSITFDSVSVPVLKIVETVRRVESNGRTSVQDRNKLVTVQTPQVFLSTSIDECFLSPGQINLDLTDEASYFENVGKKVHLVTGEKWNIKITNPEDIDWAESLLDRHKQLCLSGLDIG